MTRRWVPPLGGACRDVLDCHERRQHSLYVTDLERLGSFTSGLGKSPGPLDVITELEVIGGEVHDQKYRLIRKIRAEDPDDLDSPLRYHITVTDADAENTKIDMSGGMKPSAQRVYAVLTSDPSATLSVREIGDQLADQGKPLKARTIQDALASLGDLVSGLVIDKRGTTLWTVGEGE